MAAIVADNSRRGLVPRPALKIVALAAEALDEGSDAGDPILIPSISLVEWTYLVEKGRIPAEARQPIGGWARQTGRPIRAGASGWSVAAAVDRVDRNGLRICRTV
jgi:hypothetical protein